MWAHQEMLLKAIQLYDLLPRPPSHLAISFSISFNPAQLLSNATITSTQTRHLLKWQNGSILGHTTEYNVLQVYSSRVQPSYLLLMHALDKKVAGGISPSFPKNGFILTPTHLLNCRQVTHSVPYH